MKNIYAYTENSHPFPPFISLNQEGDKLILTVRGPAKPGQYSDKDCGNTVTIELPKEQLIKLASAAMEYGHAEYNVSPPVSIREWD